MVRLQDCGEIQLQRVAEVDVNGLYDFVLQHLINRIHGYTVDIQGLSLG